MAWYTLLVSKHYVSKRTSNRHTKLVPQPERATTAISSAPQDIAARGLLQAQLQWGENRDKFQPCLMRPGRQNFVGVQDVTDKFSDCDSPQSTLKDCVFSSCNVKIQTSLCNKIQSHFLVEAGPQTRPLSSFQRPTAAGFAVVLNSFSYSRSISVVTNVL